MPSSFDLVIPRPQFVEPGGDERFAITATPPSRSRPATLGRRWVANYLAQTNRHCRGGTTAAASSQRRHVAGRRIALARRCRRARRATKATSSSSPPIASRFARATPPACSTASRRSVSCCPPSSSTRPSARTRRGPSPRPSGRIVDEPRFGWRGAMLDVVAPLLRRRRGQALHRSDRALQAEPAAPAPVRRPGLARSRSQVARPDDARRRHRSRRR